MVWLFTPSRMSNEKFSGAQFFYCCCVPFLCTTYIRLLFFFFSCTYSHCVCACCAKVLRFTILENYAPCCKMDKKNNSVSLLRAINIHSTILFKFERVFIFIYFFRCFLLLFLFAAKNVVFSIFGWLKGHLSADYFCTVAGMAINLIHFSHRLWVNISNKKKMFP